MCMKTPKVPKPVEAVQRQAERLPDDGTIAGAVSRRMTDRMRAGASTILSRGSGSGMGATVGGAPAPAMTTGKTLLGQ